MKRRRDASGAGVDSPQAGPMLSPDLARLDRDLRGLSIEERSSFASELRAELAAEHARLQSAGPSRSTGARHGFLAAAAVVLLLIGGWLVPPARASIARWLQSSPEVEPVAADPAPEVLPPVPAAVPAVPEFPALEDLRLEPEPEPMPRPPLVFALDGSPPPIPPTLPSLVDRDLARRIVTDEYPVALQESGIGGIVRVLLWVRPDGTPETPAVRISSGTPELDEAALRATRSFRFVPATRAGQQVGTWVEFSIRFEPDSEGSQPDPEYQAFEIPLGK
ncbi:MAG: energy transducer TonB [Gemmatimonadota bacterium]|nr:energy transducer TonB [Gemmatimonadota bacterium]MDE2984112.1 energy transducer TonB [Gemmatimonadota bacterium]